MDEQPESGRVLVGLDGSADSKLALRWALLEGRATCRPVHLVHCRRPLAPASEERVRNGRNVVDEGLELCRDYPGVRVTAEVVESRGTSVAATLLSTSVSADFVVVGCRGHRPPQGPRWGSVSEYLSRHATCPVVTVRPPRDVKSTRMVLALTVPEPTEAALAYAFAHASHHGIGLTAINVWHEHIGFGAVAPNPVEHYLALEPDRHLAALNDVLEPWGAKYPDVMVTAESIGGHAAAVLRHASEHASLLVVGRPEKDGVSLLLGSMSQSMLHHAQCPIAVVGLTTSALRSPSPMPHPVSDL
jgi:nucleotide-binding universal stress UspA family protein